MVVVLCSHLRDLQGKKSQGICHFSPLITKIIFYKPIYLPETAAAKEVKPAKMPTKTCLHFRLSGMDPVCAGMGDCLGVFIPCH